MTFPRFLSTSEMAQSVAYHFEWDRRGVALPPLPLQNDFKAYARVMDLLWLRKLLSASRSLNYPRRTLHIMESALIELR